MAGQKTWQQFSASGRPIRALNCDRCGCTMSENARVVKGLRLCAECKRDKVYVEKASR